MPFSFQNLLIEQLNELYSGEQQISILLPKVIQVTSSHELREHIDRYITEVNQHIKELETCFSEFKSSPSGEKSVPIAGMVLETEAVLQRGGNSCVKDAAIIAMIQRIAHFKIAVYGTARTFARHLNSPLRDTLQIALNEEGTIDHELTHLAEGGIFSTGINEVACQEKVYS